MKLLKWTREIFLGMLGLILIFLIIGFLFERISRAKADKIQPHGQFADVGGHKLHYYKLGTDEPTVVFESAFDPSGHLQWYMLQQKISTFATTISYDRAGLLWSDRGANPKTGKAMAEELRALLEQANVSKPYILVGHSLGALILRSFIAKYPEEVRGIVLIESAIPNQKEYLSDELYEMVIRGLPGGFLKVANEFGLVRLMFTGMFPDTEEYTYQNSLMPTLLYKSAYSVLEEQDCMPALDQEARSITSFGSIPLYILSVSDRDNFDDMISDAALRTELVDALAAMQRDLLTLSTDSEQILVPDSNHYINEDQPDVIIEAVRNMIKKTGPAGQ